MKENGEQVPVLALNVSIRSPVISEAGFHFFPDIPLTLTQVAKKLLELSFYLYHSPDVMVENTIYLS